MLWMLKYCQCMKQNAAIQIMRRNLTFFFLISLVGVSIFLFTVMMFLSLARSTKDITVKIMYQKWSVIGVIA